MRAALSAGPRNHRPSGVAGIDDMRVVQVVRAVVSQSVSCTSLGASGRVGLRLLLDRPDAPTLAPGTGCIELVLAVRQSSAPATPGGRR